MRLFYRLCQLLQEQKGVLEPPELPPGYATAIPRFVSICLYRILPKISPLPSLTLKFLHRYVCLDYLPPLRQTSDIHAHAREHVRTYVRNPALQLTTTRTKMVLAFRKACFEVILL